MKDEDMIEALADTFVTSVSGITFEQFFNCYFKYNIVEVMYRRRRLEMTL